MRGAAVIALGVVVGLCLLFLAIVLPLRALKPPAPLAEESPVPTQLFVTIPPTPEPTPMIPSVLTFDESTDDPMPVKEKSPSAWQGLPPARNRSVETTRCFRLHLHQLCL